MKKQKIAIFASTMSIIASVLLIAFSAGMMSKVSGHDGGGMFLAFGCIVLIAAIASIALACVFFFKKNNGVAVALTSFLLVSVFEVLMFAFLILEFRDFPEILTPITFAPFFIVGAVALLISFCCMKDNDFEKR